MSYTIEIQDDFFGDGEVDKLKDLFGVENPDEFLEVLQNVTHVALSEYKDILLGNGIFRDDEVGKFKDLFGVEAPDKFLEVHQNVTHSALNEYKEMFLGRGFPTRAEEIKQDRLYYLIENHFKEMPTEEKVSSLFRLTRTQSGNLIRGVMARYHYELDEIFKDSLKYILEKHELVDGSCHLVIQSNYALDYLKNIVEKKDEQMKKVKNAYRKYCVSKDSLNELCDEMGIPRKYTRQ